MSHLRGVCAQVARLMRRARLDRIARSFILAIGKTIVQVERVQEASRRVVSLDCELIESESP